jgi:hypothetical protein
MGDIWRKGGYNNNNNNNNLWREISKRGVVV